MNYLSYITDEELEIMLNKMNYELAQIEDRDGKPLRKITRSLDENQKQTIFVRCRDVETKDKKAMFNSGLTKTDAGRNLAMLMLMIGNYSMLNDVGFILIKNFEFKPCFQENLFSNDEPKVDKALIFANMLKEKLCEKSPKLANYYVREYNVHVKKYNRNLRKERKQEKKQDSEQTY